MSLFLLTSEDKLTKFTEVSIDTSKIVVILLSQLDDIYRMHLNDINNDVYSAVFKTEESLRNRFKELLAVMNADTSLADTMKIAIRPSTLKEDLSKKLADLLSDM